MAESACVSAESELWVVAACSEAYSHIQAGREVGTTSNAAAQAGTQGAFLLEGRAICNNHSQSPTTSRRLLESKPIDNKRTTIALHPQESA